MVAGRDSPPRHQDTKTVVITGLGVVSPLGNSVSELTRRWRAGERAHSDADGGVTIETIPLDAVPEDTRARTGRLDRICRLFLAASVLSLGGPAPGIPAPGPRGTCPSF